MPLLNDYLRPDLFTYRWNVYGNVALLFQGDINECAQYWLTGEYPIILPDHLQQQGALWIGRLRGRVQFERGKIVDPNSVIPLFPTQELLTIEQLRNFLKSAPHKLAEIERRVEDEFASMRR